MAGFQPVDEDVRAGPKNQREGKSHQFVTAQTRGDQASQRQGEQRVKIGRRCWTAAHGV